MIKTKPEEEPSLADLFVASTHTLHKKFHGRAGKVAADVLMRYRLDMKRAHRFVLTDEFTRIATLMTFIPAEKTLARLQYATLPYETTWIEFSAHEKLRAIADHYGKAAPDLDGVSEKLGLLIQRIDDTSAVCTCVTHGGDMALPNSTSYFFSSVPTGFGERVAHGCKPVVLHTSNVVDNAHYNVARASLWGYTSKPHNTIDEAGLGDMVVPAVLERHGEVGISRINPVYMLAFAKAGSDGHSKLAKMMIDEITELTGNIRWLVTVLAMLNEVPVNTERVERSGMLRAGLTQRHNFLGYHKVTLKLPKTDPVRYFNKKLSNVEQARKRAHEVLSHWRHYMTEGHCGFDRHEWVYDEEHRHRACARCAAKSTLIPEHVRGDIKLGWVQKSYVIKPSLRAAHNPEKAP